MSSPFELDSRVRAFVSSRTGIHLDRVAPDAALLMDLGVDGDDASELMEAFGTEFNVDMAGFAHDKHFGPEGLGCFVPFVFDLFTASEDAWNATAMIPITVRDLIDAAIRGRWEPPRLCCSCGYDLRASSDRCPECGTPFRSEGAA